MNHSIPGIGLGCLYLALRTSEVEMSMSMSEYVDMWGASENISVQAVRDVITDLLEFYDQFPVNDDFHTTTAPTTTVNTPNNTATPTELAIEKEIV